jgi:hypothetical protein
MFSPKKSPRKGQIIVTLIVLLNFRDTCGDCSFTGIVSADLLISRLPQVKSFIILFYNGFSYFMTVAHHNAT